jgi:hypothetical protein
MGSVLRPMNGCSRRQNRPGVVTKFYAWICALPTLGRFRALCAGRQAKRAPVLFAEHISSQGLTAISMSLSRHLWLKKRMDIAIAIIAAVAGRPAPS